ncbi:hypothetical protein WA026_008545 [Henosepilachna vigintioctopunctata]|uniref:Shootin-1 n=1 Tax=Henosepilachna vigintioctopunctata TaxID=420089 RepID=A0AAW1UBJ3_9CUCU
MNMTSRLPPPSPIGKCSTSSIPTFQRTNSASKIPINNYDGSRWKIRFEDIEQKRKLLLTENVKLMRHNEDIQKKYTDLQEKHEQLETELFEKNEEFMKLTTASKNLYREYETLKNQYDIETGAMSSALQDASQWYKQNKELKRRTLLLLDRDAVDEGVDAGDATPDADIENLNRTIKNLSNEVATLQTEVECLKQIEFVTTEENIRLSEELEQEKANTQNLIQELNVLRKENEQLVRISEMTKKEIQDLKELEESRKNEFDVLRKEAGDYKRERNVLAHQSTLLMNGISADNVENCIALLKEVEELKRTQEEERIKYEEEINALQEKLETQSNNSQIEVLEEKLKLVECELQTATERAERAEKEVDELKKTPIAPPPPPPPLPVLPSEPPVVPLRVKRRSRINLVESTEVKPSDVDDTMTKKVGTPGVNEDIINAIKEGKFTLKKTKSQCKRDKDSSKTVSELLNILGSLRRAPKKRQSLIVNESKS